MNKAMLTAAFAGALLFATAAMAGEYKNYCAPWAWPLAKRSRH